jgi:hypothetical protein
MNRLVGVGSRLSFTLQRVSTAPEIVRSDSDPDPPADPDPDTPVCEDPEMAGEDPGILTHGMLTGLVISVPLWLGLAWLICRLAEILAAR